MTDKCLWEYECDHPEYQRYYYTECGESHMFSDGKISDNKFKYCPYCGKQIKEVKNEG